MEIKTQEIAISKIVANTGQIQGLPANPRTIKDYKYIKLVKSIKDNPEMLNMRELLVYPHKDKYVVIGGNMRLRALKELKYTSAPCKIIPQEATVEQLRAYTIKDNNGYGEWDFDLLSKDWDAMELSDWGLDFTPFTELDIIPVESTPHTSAPLVGGTESEFEGLPEELQGVDILPNQLPKIEGNNETEYERVIIVFPSERKDELCALLGLDSIDKILYRFDELPIMQR